MAIQARFSSDNFRVPTCGHPLQDLLIDNHGRGISYQASSNVQQQLQQPNSQEKQLPQLQQLMPGKQDMFWNNNIMFSASKDNNNNNNCATTVVDNSLPSPTLYSRNMVDQVAKQWQEMDRYLISQNENFRMALQEQRKHQWSSMLKKFETKAQLTLRQKDEEIARAWRRRMELEVFVSKLESENQAWQRLAQENEALVMSLNNTLEQMKERVSHASNSMEDDAESCCDVKTAERRVGEAEECRGGYGDCEGGNVGQRTNSMMVCKSCGSRRSCVVFLPCRHLCSCSACEPFFEACPVCRTPKKAMVEALIS